MFLPAADGMPSYHVPMLNDKDRNRAYAVAIEQRISEFKREQGYSPSILDLGSGSGLLSIMALQYGASSVTLCEANSDLISLSRTALCTAHPGADVHYVNKLSTKLPPTKQYDMVISELIGSMLNSESMMSYMHDLIRRGILRTFLGDKRYTVPMSGSMSMCAHECPVATGIDTGLSYAPMQCIFDAVYDMAPTRRLQWIQDEEIKVCLASASRRALSDPVKVLEEEYGTLDAVSVTTLTEISMTVKQSMKPILVLEWTVQLCDSVRLVHTLDYVRELEPQVRNARWVNWGFLYAPLPATSEGQTMHFKVKRTDRDLIVTMQNERKK